MKPVLARVLLPAFAAWCGACGSGVSSHEEALFDLEQLAFVPALSVRIPPIQVVGEECVVSEPLLVDRYEVPRGRWLAYLRQAASDSVADALVTERAWTEDTWSWPATWMNLPEARAFARSRGMRLLTAREWLVVACGSRALPFPWGQSRASLVANTLEMGLARPLPVGTFEQGATPYSTYEMLGNVREWVEEPIDVGRPGDSDPRELAWALGGSFATWLEPLYSTDELGRPRYQAQTLDPLTAGSDIGLRCVVSARTYLLAHADDFGSDEETHARLVAIGQRFGRDAAPLLEELVRSQSDSRALRWLHEGASK